MPSAYAIPLWKIAPFIRLILPLFVGVISQWYLKINILLIGISGLITVTTYFTVFLLGIAKRYGIRHLQGGLIQLIIFLAGALLTWHKDIKNDPNWFAHNYKPSDYLVVTVDEPLIKKSKSYKADGIIYAGMRDKQMQPLAGKVIMYFRDTPELGYGHRILLKKPLQPIRNSGNPAAFDYARYAAFQQKFHTVFLNADDYVVLNGKFGSSFTASVYQSRDYILQVLKKYVGKDQSIIGIAEALLIGYKHDLDKDIMQAYSNTGVVHIIAISGLHLGLIYFMLNWLMHVLPWIKRQATLKVFLVLISLWLFSILTGSSASVLRSALMFTCILIGKTYFKQSSTYNAIAASAFMLVCYNPYFLWDVGFQLSYLAVLGIVWLQKPIQHILYIKNTWLAKVWSMIAVTLAAQLAAFPLCIFYFHQFPNLFLPANIIAVPLSTLILFAEIFLLCFSWANFIAIFIGKMISIMIATMNGIITFCNQIPWSVTNDIYATVFTTWILYGIVFFASAWLMSRRKKLLKVLLLHITVFAFLHIYADVKHAGQHRLIIYNIPKQQAMDFIVGNTVQYHGDSLAKKGGFMYNFHIRPARICYQANVETRQKYQGDSLYTALRFAGKRILIFEKPVAYKKVGKKIDVDILILSRNADLKISGLMPALKPELVVFDASNSLWKIEQWKKECSALLLPFHSIPDQGAFVLDLNEP